MKIAIFAVVGLLLFGGGGAAAYFIFGGSKAEPAAETVAGSEGELVEPVNLNDLRDPLYVSLNPAFMVTFKNGSSLRYLQTELSIMSFEQDVITEIENNRPAVRNKILMHISGQDYDGLETVEGRESLRETVKEAVQQTLRTNLKVEEVYFNTFVMQ